MIIKNKDGSISIDIETDDLKLEKISKITLSQEMVRIIQRMKDKNIEIIESIKIWKFNDAPKEYQNKSVAGGDEDWIALIPPNYQNEYLDFLSEGTSFGCCNVNKIILENGYKLLIGSHA